MPRARRPRTRWAPWRRTPGTSRTTPCAASKTPRTDAIRDWSKAADDLRRRVRSGFEDAASDAERRARDLRRDAGNGASRWIRLPNLRVPKIETDEVQLPEVRLPRLIGGAMRPAREEAQDRFGGLMAAFGAGALELGARLARASGRAVLARRRRPSVY